MIRKRARGGLSLLEVMVYMTLVLIVMGSALMIVILANRFFYSTQDNNAVQREAQTTMLRLSRELEESTVGKVLLSEESEPPGVIFLSPRTADNDFAYDFGGDGLLLWQKWVCYSVGLNEKGDPRRLLRVESYLGTPATTPDNILWTTTDFQALGSQQIVASDLLSFHIEPDPSSTGIFNIQASFGREGRTNNTNGDPMAEKVHIENSVHLRN